MCWQSHWTRLSLLRVKSFFSKGTPDFNQAGGDSWRTNWLAHMRTICSTLYTRRHAFLISNLTKSIEFYKKNDDDCRFDQGATWCCETNQWKEYFRIDTRRMSNRMKRCTQIPTPTLAFSAFSLSDTSWRTAHTLSTVIVQARIVKIIPSSHHCWLALPEFDGNCIHDLTILWLFFSLSHSFACQLRDVWRNDYSRVQCRLWAQQWDWYDRKVFSDILLQLPSWKCCI